MIATSAAASSQQESGVPQPHTHPGEPHTAALALCCGAAMASLVPVMLFQLDQIPRLPDPPLRIFDSEAITSSRQAHPFGLPDAPLGLVSYAVTLALIATALPGREAPHSRPPHPLLRRLLTVKLALDGALALNNSVTQVAHFRRVCSYCMGTALATAGMLVCGRRLFLPAVADAIAPAGQWSAPAAGGLPPASQPQPPGRDPLAQTSL